PPTNPPISAITINKIANHVAIVSPTFFILLHFTKIMYAFQDMEDKFIPNLKRKAELKID
ncbi:hypothetical protein O0I59_10335, partial [Staphylococcus pseudintermedius]|nr:hypothetical protein [Staphylococcus pseudintermedius]